MTSSWTWSVDTGEWSQVNRALNRYFRRKLPEHDHEDLTGDVWLAAARKYRGKGSLHCFVFAVARLLTYTVLHRRKRPTLVESRTDEAVAPGPGPESILTLLAEHEALTRALEKIAEPYRDALRLSLDGRSNLQIAAELGIRYNTVRSRLSRGRARVIDALRDELEPR